MRGCLPRVFEEEGQGAVGHLVVGGGSVAEQRHADDAGAVGEGVVAQVQVQQAVQRDVLGEPGVVGWAVAVS
jgi:hypothetical protein